MDTVVVTQYWMYGVMGIMVAFGICALIGYSKQNSK